jgi:hypothetical protein
MGPDASGEDTLWQAAFKNHAAEQFSGERRARDNNSGTLVLLKHETCQD